MTSDQRRGRSPAPPHNPPPRTGAGGAEATRFARPAPGQPAFVQGLGLVSATTLVMGSMIGSGIFIVSADVARQVKSPGLLILCWLIGAALTIIAALSYGELAAAMPHAGGQYVYLREAFGRLWGFLYGWTLFAVIQTGTIAAVAVAFAKYTGIFLPSISANNYLLGSGKIGLTTQQLLASSIVILLTLVSTRGIRTGATVQNVFTFAKVASLLALVGFGFLLGRNPHAIDVNFHDFWRGADWNFATVALVGSAMVGPLFSSDAWNNVTFTAGEVRNPKRNLPLSLGLGVGVVVILYIACNLIYLSVLTLPQIQNAPEDRVATAVVSAMFGPAATKLMAIAIMVSTFGCCNGMIMSGARVYFTMARDNLFFRRAGTLDPVHRTPVFALAIQCVWTVLLTLSGQYNDLLDYVIFAVLLFYILTIGGLFRLRRTRPELPRPYRAAGYPVLPALYMLVAGVIEILLLINKPAFTVRGLIIVLLGVPVYFLWRGKQEPSS
jgi:APA family basic amino acid/polyamine antiporter